MMNSYSLEVSLVSRMVDGLNNPVDFGILKTVAVLRLHGFNIIASCEGHVIDGCQTSMLPCPYPWIIIQGDSNQHKLDKMLNDFYSQLNSIITPKYQTVSINKHGEYKLMPYAKIDESGDRDPEILMDLQRTLNDFTDFMLGYLGHVQPQFMN